MAVAAQPATPDAPHGEVVHDPAVGGMHRRAVGGGDVDATVEVMAGAGGIVGLEGVAGTTEALRNGAVHRPLPLTGGARAVALFDQGRDLGLQGGPLRLHLLQLPLELRLDGGDLLLAGGP